MFFEVTEKLNQVFLEVVGEWNIVILERSLERETRSIFERSANEWNSRI